MDDIRVHTAQLVATIDREGRLVMVSGRTARAITSGSAVFSAGQAIGMAARRVGAAPAAMPLASATRARGLHRFANVYARGLRQPEPVSAELVWFITEEGLRLSWLTDVEVGPGAWYGTVIDAETGATLERQSRYKHSGPDGDVFTTQHPDAAGASARASRSPASTARGSLARSRAGTTSTPTVISTTTTPTTSTSRVTPTSTSATRSPTRGADCPTASTSSISLPATSRPR